MQATPRRPLMIVDHQAIYREGLRRCLYEFGFCAIWSDDHLPDDLPTALRHQTPEVLLIGTSLGRARRPILETKRLYPTCRIVLLRDANPEDNSEAALECGADSIIPRESSGTALHATLQLLFAGLTVMPSDVIEALRQSCETQGPGGLVDGGQGTSAVMPPGVKKALPGSYKDAGERADARQCTSPQPGELPEPPAALSDSLGWTAPPPLSVIHASPIPMRGLTPRELTVLQGLKEGLANKEIARQLEITEPTVKVHVKAILRKTGARNRTQVAMWWASRQQLNGTSDGFPSNTLMIVPAAA